MFLKTVILHCFVFGVIFISFETKSIDLSDEPILFPKTFNIPSRFSLINNSYGADITDDLTELAQAAATFSVAFCIVCRKNFLILHEIGIIFNWLDVIE